MRDPSSPPTEATVLSLTRSQMRLTASALGLVSLIVIVLALTGSRTVTRPVGRLDIAGRSIYCDETGGDYCDFLDLSADVPAGRFMTLYYVVIVKVE